jgi:hypothetical protein
MHYLNPFVFENAVSRGALSHRSKELKLFIDAMKDYWGNQTPQKIRVVYDRYLDWKMKNPKEFKDRGKPIELSLQKEFDEEYARWGLTYLGTDAQAAQPFLADQGRQPLSPNQVSPFYYYHAAQYDNLVGKNGILRKGLQPSHGGRGGAGDALGGKAGARFNARSVGVVHGSPDSHTAVFYALLKDKTDLEKFGKMSLILRFPKGVVPAAQVERDPDDPRNCWRIKIPIQPRHIEALTTEGWVPVQDLTALEEVFG